MKKTQKPLRFLGFEVLNEKQIISWIISISAWITPEPGKYQGVVWDFSSFCA